MISHYKVSQPEAFLAPLIDEFKSTKKECLVFSLEYPHEQYYLPGSPVLQLLALILLKRKGEAVSIEVGLMEASKGLRQRLSEIQTADPVEAAKQTEMALLDLGQPLILSPVSISKPWGHEIWFTGIEARGQSAVSVKDKKVPLPWVLSLMPEYLVGSYAKELILLKILDPIPEETYGDLYFEVHEKKQEVYIVTHVDKAAWPEGVGKVRIGFNQDKRKQFKTDHEFRQGYLKVVKAYEKVRREVDEALDRYKEKEGYLACESVPVAVLKQWVDRLPEALRQREINNRQSMEEFMGEMSLAQGDVVSIPCLVPHSLMHGVRVVEFQTPVYERKILSFAQKVVTQSHWDTESVIDKLELSAFDPDCPELVETPDWLSRARAAAKVERIVDFTGFEVHRVQIDAEQSVRYCPGRLPYSLVMAITHGVYLDGGGYDDFLMEEELGVFMPGSSDDCTFINKTKDSAILLVALPR